MAKAKVRWGRSRGLLVVAALLLAAAPARASVGGIMLGLSAGGGLLNEHDSSEGMWDLGFWAEKVGHVGSALAPFIELRGVPWHGQQYSARLGTIIGWHGQGCALLLPTSEGGPGQTVYRSAGRYECVRGLELAVTTFFSERDVSPAIELGFGRAGPGHFYLGASFHPVHGTWGGRLSWMMWGSRSTGLAAGLIFEGLVDDDLRVPMWGGVVLGWGGGSR